MLVSGLRFSLTGSFLQINCAEVDQRCGSEARVFQEVTVFSTQRNDSAYRDMLNSGACTRPASDPYYDRAYKYCTI